MDLTESIAPKSDQLNAEDLLTGPRTFTVEKVTKGSAEQPVDIHLVEFPGRPFRPSKTVRRILVNAWGPDASAYTGRRMTLYRDPAVKFGGMDVGGIRVSHLSHIDKALTVALAVTRGKRAPYTVKPLADETPAGVVAGEGPTPAGHRNRIPAGWTGPFLSETAAPKRMWALLGERFPGDETAQRDFMHGAVTRDWSSSKELDHYEVLTIILALTNGDAA